MEEVVVDGERIEQENEVHFNFFFFAFKIRQFLPPSPLKTKETMLSFVEFKASSPLTFTLLLFHGKSLFEIDQLIAEDGDRNIFNKCFSDIAKIAGSSEGFF